MKALCIVSHQISGEEGRYQRFIAGEVYDRPEGEELGPHFVPAPEPESPPKKKGGK